jgi:outer membrane protein assembly factor BamE (lipoprotein component of BamABCDE complex)
MLRRKKVMKSKGSDSSISHGCRVLCFVLLLGGSAVLTVFPAGCATVGRDFPVSHVSEIEKGKTTQDQIRTLFGPPWRVGVEDGETTWTYGKYRYTLLGQKEAQDLVIRFDNRNVVSSYTFSTTKHEE